MKRGDVIKILLLTLCILFFIENVKAQSISLTETSDNYTIENEYYKAVIPKANCIVLALYVKNSTGNWSNNLAKGSAIFYGLGYLEGRSDATGNDASGLQSSCTGMIILENTSTRIKIISYNNNYAGSNFTEVWTFWAKKPYFQSEASVIVVDENGYNSMANQFQFCWMINDSLNNTMYQNNESNSVVQPSAYQMHQIHSPNFTNYPWVNWQFPNESVSLGLIFTDIYDHYGTIGEPSGSFEYQLDFELGSGLQGNPVKKNYTRQATTIYYTTNRSTNDDIANFTINHYQNASTNIKQNPVLQASSYVNSPFYQNPGFGSALVNSPYFLVRQNFQNSHVGNTRTQYETSIYAPIYKHLDIILTPNNDFTDQLIYSLNYNNGSNISIYGNISQISTNNSDYETSLQMNATSNDSKLFYSSTFKSWNDSDKLKILGSASNASANASIKEIYVSLAMPSWGRNKYEAETAGPPSPYINTSLTTNDNLWTNYTYGYASGMTLIYRDNMETVPPLAIPLSLPDGPYDIIAYVQQSTVGDINYSCSTDNQTWTYFTAKNASSVAIIPIDVGLKNITNGTFYIGDDKNAAAGIAGWAGWDMVTFGYVSNLSSNVYDVRLGDPIYGKLGIAVKVNSPISNISIINNSEMRIYLYQNSSVQNLTNFSYPFDIEIYPHKGWLNDSSQFTGLHSREILNYTQHVFYVPEGIHNGRTNTIYSSGAVDYSLEPYNDSSKVNMTVIPSTGSLILTITGFSTDSKTWSETASSSTATTNHTIGNLKANIIYNVNINGNLWNIYTSNSSGYINFIYDGGYSTKTFEVVEPSSSTAATSGTGYPTFTSNQSQLEEGYTKSLYVGWEIEFEFENETHTIILKDIINKTAIITLSSAIQTFNLTANETKKLDLNADRFYDLQISAETITDLKADLILQSIHEKVLVEESNQSTSPEKTNKEIPWQLIIFLVFSLIGFIVIILIIKKVSHRKIRKIKPKTERKKITRHVRHVKKIRKKQRKNFLDIKERREELEKKLRKKRIEEIRNLK